MTKLVFSAQMSRRAAMGASLLAAAGCQAASEAKVDPLASWQAGPARDAITSFVARVTREAGEDYVPPAERIAVFDNDGTLWAEQPIYFQFAFAIDRIRALAPQHPEWNAKPVFQKLIAGDPTALAGVGEKDIVEVVAASHAGISTDAFARIVSDWLASARHPQLERPYDQLVYQPMIELLAYLRANSFKTFIVSGGGVEFIRVFAERIYGIPPEQVVGSSGKTVFTAGEPPVLMKAPAVEFVDDGAGKPVGINRFIGRRPIFSFGNSDGDQQMLEWTAGGGGLHFAGLVHHTDGAREFAYDRSSHVGKLDKAWDEAGAKGWIVVDMRRDWRNVFPPVTV